MLVTVLILASYPMLTRFLDSQIQLTPTMGMELAAKAL